MTAAAAMRYTEARLTKLAGRVAGDIEKETSTSGPLIHDESRVELLVLPSGAGICWSMARAALPSVTRPTFRTRTIWAKSSKGCSCCWKPRGHDRTNENSRARLPTAGFILRHVRYRDAYETGRTTVRAKVATETDERTDRERLIITEIPYQVNKAAMQEKISIWRRENADRYFRYPGRVRPRWRARRDRTEAERDRGVVLNQLYRFSPLERRSASTYWRFLVNNRPEQHPKRNSGGLCRAPARSGRVGRTAYDLRKAGRARPYPKGSRSHWTTSGCRDRVDPVLAIARRRARGLDAAVPVV